MYLFPASTLVKSWMDLGSNPFPLLEEGIAAEVEDDEDGRPFLLRDEDGAGTKSNSLILGLFATEGLSAKGKSMRERFEEGWIRDFLGSLSF